MVKESVSNAQRAGLEVLVYFIFGLPGETKESMEKTLEFAKSLSADIVTFWIATPHPKTEFYNFLDKGGYLKTKDWSKYDPMFMPPYDYPQLSSGDIFLSTRRTYRSYYLRPKYMIQRIQSLLLLLAAVSYLLLFFIPMYSISFSETQEEAKLYTNTIQVISINETGESITKSQIQILPLILVILSIRMIGKEQWVRLTSG